MTLEEFKKKYQKAPVKEFPNNVEKELPEPMVSCRVSTYMHGDFIRQCLDGILMQKTNFPFEILVGEDESTDGTREICLEYAKKHSSKIRLFLHSRENNILIDGSPSSKFQSRYTQYHCRGKYIAFCEGDDYWTDPYKLQKQVNFLEANPDYSMCFTDYTVINEAGKILKKSGMHPDAKKDYTHLDVLRRYTPKTLTSVFRRKALPVESLTKYRVVPNGDTFFFGIVTQFGSAKYIDEVTGAYRRHRGGIWSLISDVKKYANQLKTYDVMWDNFKGDKQRKVLSKRIQESASILFWKTANTSEFDTCHKLIFKSLIKTGNFSFWWQLNRKNGWRKIRPWKLL